MKEMVGGCCVCSDDRGWAENPLVYCDGQGCTVAVHQACYGIVTVPQGNWYCRKCEAGDRSAKLRCELCPSRDGALKPTDNNGWAHVVCALYIPEVRFGNVTTMEPIILAQVPPERFSKPCYICEEGNKGTKASIGACMSCNKAGCRQQFHVTCAQSLGLLCEEAGNYMDNVKYCGYCHHHYTKLVKRKSSRRKYRKPVGKRKGGNVKPIPPYRPVTGSESPNKEEPTPKTATKRKLSTSSKGSKADEGEPGGEDQETKLPASSFPSGPPAAENPISDAKSISKKRKGGNKSPPQSPEPRASPRPVTPKQSSQNSSSNNSPSNTGQSSKSGGTTVVQAPVESAMQNPVPGTSQQSTPGPSSSPVSDKTDPSEVPVKRGRSQSTDKSRRSKRSTGKIPSTSQTRPTEPSQSPTPTPQPTPPPKPPSPDPEVKRNKPVKEEKDMKISPFQNGVTAAPHMLGNQLNPTSMMAQKMSDTLSQEVAAHSIFSSEPNLSTQQNLFGPQLPKPTGATGRGTPSTTASNGPVTWNTHSSQMPQSLDQLLERQWEQGSQFLMEQAQHFDIASLLSCLYQLRAENAQLEEHVNSLLARRDHLLAVNARLAIPLVAQPQANNVGNGTPGLRLAGGASAGSVGNALPPLNQPLTLPGPIENGLATPAEQQQFLHKSSPNMSMRGQIPAQVSGGPTPYSLPTTSSTVVSQSSVVVRASSQPDRRVSGSGGNFSGSLYSPNQPSTSQQSQVLIRRDEGSHQSLAPSAAKNS